MTVGLFDTSVLIASETGRPLDTARLPDEWVVSVVTVAELHAGVHAAADVETRARRMESLAELGDVEVLPIDERVGLLWARMRATLAESGRRANVNDLWIAATAVANDMPVVTHDGDFAAIAGLAGLRVVEV